MSKGKDRERLPERATISPDHPALVKIISGSSPARIKSPDDTVEPLSALISAALAAASSSEHTRRSYERSLADFFFFLERERGSELPQDCGNLVIEKHYLLEKGKRQFEFPAAAANVLSLIDARVLDAYRVHLSREETAVSTLRNRIAAVRTFLSVAYRDGYLSDETARHMGIGPYRSKIKKEKQISGRRLTEEEVERLRASVLMSSVIGIRDRAILDTFLFLGLRCEELVKLRLSNFIWQENAWWCQLLGKGRKKRMVRLRDPLPEELNNWLSYRKLKLGGASADRIFVSMKKGDHLKTPKDGPVRYFDMDTSAVFRLVCRYAIRAKLGNVEGNKHVLSPHDLRRSCARAMHEKGASILSVRDFLGHESVETTSIYIGLLSEDPTQHLPWAAKEDTRPHATSSVPAEAAHVSIQNSAPADRIAGQNVGIMPSAAPPVSTPAEESSEEREEEQKPIWFQKAEETRERWKRIEEKSPPKKPKKFLPEYNFAFRADLALSVTAQEIKRVHLEDREPFTIEAVRASLMNRTKEKEIGQLSCYVVSGNNFWNDEVVDLSRTSIAEVEEAMAELTRAIEADCARDRKRYSWRKEEVKPCRHSHELFSNLLIFSTINIYEPVGRQPGECYDHLFFAAAAYLYYARGTSAGILKREKAERFLDGERRGARAAGLFRNSAYAWWNISYWHDHNRRSYSYRKMDIPYAGTQYGSDIERGEKFWATCY